MPGSLGIGTRPMPAFFIATVFVDLSQHLYCFSPLFYSLHLPRPSISLILPVSFGGYFRFLTLGKPISWPQLAEFFDNYSMCDPFINQINSMMAHDVRASVMSFTRSKHVTVTAFTRSKRRVPRATTLEEDASPPSGIPFIMSSTTSSLVFAAFSPSRSYRSSADPDMSPREQLRVAPTT